MSAPPYWTDADAAEFDLLLDTFVDAYWHHRERCAICRRGGPWCDPLREGLDLVVEWRRRRLLRSEAAYLRARQDFVDWETAA